jgi:CheY-like chemotaxis protein
LGSAFLFTISYQQQREILDVLRELRNDSPRTFPVIALTADAMPALHNMELAGFDHILTKPLKSPT